MSDELKDGFHLFRGENTLEGMNEIRRKISEEGIIGLMFAVPADCVPAAILCFPSGPIVPMDIDTAEKMAASLRRSIERAKEYAKDKSP